MECQQEECAQILLEDRADPNTKDKAGMSCLHYAVRDGLHNMMLLLLSQDKTEINIKDNVCEFIN